MFVVYTVWTFFRSLSGIEKKIQNGQTCPQRCTKILREGFVRKLLRSGLFSALFRESKKKIQNGQTCPRRRTKVLRGGNLFVSCYGLDFFPLSFGNRKKRFRTDKLAPDGVRRYSEGEFVRKLLRSGLFLHSRTYLIALTAFNTAKIITPTSANTARYIFVNPSTPRSITNAFTAIENTTF